MIAKSYQAMNSNLYPVLKIMKLEVDSSIVNTPLVNLNQIETATDIRISDAGFAATEATVEAITEAGKTFFAQMFGVGAVSVNMPKSKAIDFAIFAKQKGVNVA
jgi:hypothetical protein